ncbi:unnamed protein product [Calypogeia fissa]
METTTGLRRSAFRLRKGAAVLLLLLLPLCVVCEVSKLVHIRRKAFLPRQHLQFSSSGDTFKVAIIADLHYGENSWTDWGPAQDVKSTGVQDFVLDTEQPDFVIYLGDLVTANNVAADNASAYWTMATAPAVDRSIPFATAFGNHDDMPMEFDDSWFGPSGSPLSSPDYMGYYQRTTRQQLLIAEMQSVESLTQAGPKSLWPSLSNYVLTVASSKNPGSIAAIFYFLDSGGGTYQEVVSASQAAWFTTTAETLNPEGSIPELVFFHIPTLTHQQVGMTPGGPINAPCVGSINIEAVAPQVAEWGLIDALSKRPSVKATFSGHNHGLDWCCPFETLWLCFARHTGYGGYGTWIRGARILELTEVPNFAVTTWIRLENGSVVAESTL